MMRDKQYSYVSNDKANPENDKMFDKRSSFFMNINKQLIVII